MIKVIIERHAKKGERLSPLWEVRQASMNQPGHISSEVLVSTKDQSKIMVISTWRSLEDWQAWEASETRAKLYQRMEPLLVEKSKVRTYRIAAADEGIG